jgi:hypothetical protein
MVSANKKLAYRLGRGWLTVMTFLRHECRYVSSNWQEGRQFDGPLSAVNSVQRFCALTPAASIILTHCFAKFAPTGATPGSSESSLLQ